MSMWCPKCNKVNYNKEKCDFCGHVMNNTSKSYDIPKPNKVRIIKPKSIQTKETLSFIDEVVDKLFSENKKPIKKNFKENTKKTYHDKKIRGDEYEEYIAEHYRKLGYHVIEHGKEQGVKDGGIDLIAKLGNEVILIQCKDWNENNSHKIDHKDIKVLRIDASDFLEKNPIYKNCEIKLRYTLSGNFLHKSAEKHMEECKEDISYEVIKPTYRKEELSRQHYTKKPARRKRTKQNKDLEKIILGTVIIVISFILIPMNKTKEIGTNDTSKNMIVTTDSNHVVKQKEKRNLLQLQKEKMDKYHKEQKAIRDKNQQEQQIKMDKYKAEQRKKIVEKKAIADRKRHSEREKILKIENKKSEKEEAKAILMMQMQD